eukprot:6044851-Pyramimonas_sp.AAC.1
MAGPCFGFDPEPDGPSPGRFLFRGFGGGGRTVHRSQSTIGISKTRCTQGRHCATLRLSA